LEERGRDVGTLVAKDLSVVCQRRRDELCVQVRDGVGNDSFGPVREANRFQESNFDSAKPLILIHKIGFVLQK
jgi:hypothetical protein